MDNFQGDLTDIIRSSNSTTTAAATTPPDHGRRRQSRGSHQGNTAAADDLHHVERLLSLGSLNVEDDDPACSSIDPYHAMRFSDFIDPFLVIGGTSCDDSRFRFSATKMVDAAATRGGEEDPGDIIPNSYNYCNHNCYSYNDDDPSSVGRDSPLTAAVVEASSSPPRRQPPPAGGGGGENEDDSTNIIVCGDLKVSATGGCGSSSSNYDAAAGIQIPSPRNPALKRRRSQAKKVVCIPAPAAASSRQGGGEVVPSDLWAWRKYGQKPIKGSPYPRGYYRCSSSKGCSARKQVERSRTDPNMLVITYTSEHNHPWPTQRNSLAGSTRSHHASKTSRDKSSALSTQMAPPASITIKEEEEERLEAPHQIVVTTTTTSHHVTNGTPSCSTSPTLIRRHNNIIDIDDDQLMSNQGFYDPYRGGSAGGVADHVDDQDEMDLLFAELGDLLFTGQPRFSDQDKQSRDQLGPFSGLF